MISVTAGRELGRVISELLVHAQEDGPRYLLFPGLAYPLVSSTVFSQQNPYLED